MGVPGACTVHANSATEALEKLSILPLLAGRNIDREFIAPALAASIDLVVHCVRHRAGERRVQEVVALTGEVDEGRICTERLYRAEHRPRVDAGFRRRERPSTEDAS